MIIRLIDRISISLAGVAGIALLLMLGLTVGDVVLRLVGIPLDGAYELIGLMAVVVNGLALAEAQRSKSHIAIDLIMNLTPKRVQLYVGILVTLVSGVLIALLAQHLLLYSLNMRDTGSATPSLQLEIWPAPMVLAIGVGALALALVADLVALGGSLRSNALDHVW